MYRKHTIILVLMSFFSIIGIMFALLSASMLRSTAQANQYWAIGYYIATPPIALTLTSYYC